MSHRESLKSIDMLKIVKILDEDYYDKIKTITLNTQI